jgi:hypothetical protein
MQRLETRDCSKDLKGIAYLRLITTSLAREDSGWLCLEVGLIRDQRRRIIGESSNLRRDLLFRTRY